MGRNRTRLERLIAIGCESTIKGTSSLPSAGLLAAWMQSRVNSLFVIPYLDDATCGSFPIISARLGPIGFASEIPGWALKAGPIWSSKERWRISYPCSLWDEMFALIAEATTPVAFSGPNGAVNPEEAPAPLSAQPAQG